MRINHAPGLGQAPIAAGMVSLAEADPTKPIGGDCGRKTRRCPIARSEGRALDGDRFDALLKALEAVRSPSHVSCGRPHS